MMKNVLKLVFILLLLISVVIVPLIGVSFYDSPGIFQDEPFLTNRQFGGGSSVYLKFSDSSDKTDTAKNYKAAAKILKERFTALGYTDIDTQAMDSSVRLDISEKNKDAINTLVTQYASLGAWNFVGADTSSVLCDASMVKSAEVVSNRTEGGYSIRLNFNKSGAKTFYSNVSSYAITGSNFYLMLDGNMAAYATVNSSKVKDYFTFGAYTYESASLLAAMINGGELAAAMEIDHTEKLAPSFGKGLTIGIYSAVAVLMVALCVAMILVGKKAGIFAIFALIANISVFVTAMLNNAFIFNLTTLLTMTACLLLGSIFSVLALHPVGKSLADKNSVSGGAFEKFSKYNIKAIVYHGIAFLATLLLILVARGTFFQIIECALIFSCANFITYFLFTYLGVHTLANWKN